MLRRLALPSPAASHPTVPHEPASNPPPDVRRLAALAVVGVFVLLALLPHGRIPEILMDDALITFRYAGNVAEGHGLVYNPGERVLGTTTPAWALILGGGGLLVGWNGIPLLAQLINGLLVAATGAVLGHATVRLTARPLLGAAVAGAAMLGPYTLFAGMSGMETPLFGFLTALAFLAWSGGRWRWMGLAAGLTVPVRPEGVFVVAVFGLEWLRRRQGRGVLPLAGLALPGVITAAAAWAFYGSPLPHSVAAKSAGLYPLTFSDSFARFRLLLVESLTGGALLGEWASLCVLVLGATWLLRRRPDLWMVPALLGLLSVFYATSRTLLFPHYIALVEPWALLLWGAALYGGAAFVLERLGAAGGVDGRRWIGTPLLLAVFALVLFRPLDYYPWHSVANGTADLRDATVTRDAVRTVYYRALAEVVGPSLEDGTVVLMPEIGELGFRLPHVRVLDAAALVSPEALRHLPVPPDQRAGPEVGAIPTSLVREARPDVVITLEFFATHSIHADPWFMERYEEVLTWREPGLVWGPLRIHVRRDSPRGDGLRRPPPRPR